MLIAKRVKQFISTNENMAEKKNTNRRRWKIHKTKQIMNRKLEKTNNSNKNTRNDTFNRC